MDKIITEEDEDDEIDASEETHMLLDKPTKVLSNKEYSRKSAEKRKSGVKIYSKLNYLYFSNS